MGNHNKLIPYKYYGTLDNFMLKRTKYRIGNCYIIY